PIHLTPLLEGGRFCRLYGGQKQRTPWRKNGKTRRFPPCASYARSKTSASGRKKKTSRSARKRRRGRVSRKISGDATRPSGRRPGEGRTGRRTGARATWGGYKPMETIVTPRTTYTRIDYIRE